MARRDNHAFLAAITLLTLTVGPAAAQDAPRDPARQYPLPTYEENWQFLRDPQRHADPWDAVKYVLLGDNVYASFGGEGRESYERFGNRYFGLMPLSPNGYLLQRYLFHSDVHFGSHFRMWGELNSSFENGRVGGPRRVVDEDKLDLHQAFLEVNVLQRPDVVVRLRGGRQEIALGSGRLYALREGPNVPLSFDAVRVIVAETGAWRVDAWAARPVTTTLGVFDDRSDHQFTVWGAYLSTPAVHHASFDVYYMGWDRQNAHFDKGTAHERRHTFGARLSQRGVWAYDAEAIFQLGTFGPGDIRAWRGVIEGSRSISAPWTPRIGIDLDVASGIEVAGVLPSEPSTLFFKAGPTLDGHNCSGQTTRSVLSQR